MRRRPAAASIIAARLRRCHPGQAVPDVIPAKQSASRDRKKVCASIFAIPDNACGVSGT